MLAVWSYFPLLFPNGQPKISFAFKRAMPSKAFCREEDRHIQRALPHSIWKGKGNCGRKATSHEPEGKAALPHILTVVSN